MSPAFKKKISIIVAIAENNAIGKNNELLWRLSEDLRRFKKFTTGHMVIMGRNTFLSLPKGALPNRTNMVISDVDGEQFENCIMVASVPQALAQVEDDQEAFVIGGGMVYKQFIPHARRLYLTIVHHSFEADTFFPQINYDEWSEIERSFHKADGKNEFDHSFILYERKKDSRF